LVENFTSPLEWRRPWAKEKKREVKSEKNPIGEVDLEFYPSIQSSSNPSIGHPSQPIYYSCV